jgi:formylglycine-generating enzyme required for sulfatase activity
MPQRGVSAITPVRSLLAFSVTLALVGGAWTQIAAAQSASRTAAQARAAAERLAPVADREFQDCAECPAMVAIPSGTYWMGSPTTEKSRLDDEKQHRVTIPAPFAMGETEVTFAQWDACARDGYCRAIPRGNEGDRGWGRGSRPVIEASWNDITGAGGETRGFLAWLEAKTGARYQLPTEAQWEYAARGKISGSQSEPPFYFASDQSDKMDLYFGSDKMDLCRYENIYVCVDGPSGAAPVGRFPANPFGLHDMLGNVAEWVQDCYVSYDAAPADGSAAPETAGCLRVVRGGSWDYYAWFSRAAVRDRDGPARRTDFRGFRVARAL